MSETSPDELVPIAHLLRVLRAFWWLVAAAVVAGAATAYAASVSRVAEYESATVVTLEIHPLIWHINMSLYKPVDPGAMERELLIVGGVEMAEAAAERLATTPAAVQSALTATLVGGQSIRIAARGRDRRLVRRLLPTVLALYREQRRTDLGHALSARRARLLVISPVATGLSRGNARLELGRIRTLRSLLPSGVDIVDPPSSPRKIEPRPVWATAVGGALGLLVGLGAALLLSALPVVGRRHVA